MVQCIICGQVMLAESPDTRLSLCAKCGRKPAPVAAPPERLFDASQTIPGQLAIGGTDGSN